MLIFECNTAFRMLRGILNSRLEYQENKEMLIVNKIILNNINVIKIITLNGGSLGSWIDEERS